MKQTNTSRFADFQAGAPLSQSLHSVYVPAQQEREIPEQVERISSGLGKLTELVSSLEQRLECALSPAAPEAGGELKETNRTFIGARLASIADQQGCLVGRIGSLLDRLEL